MYLVVGLGNPGPQYSKTRHNIGFLALDALSARVGHTPAKSEHKAFTTRIKIGDTDVMLAAPQTFMNLSGEAVQALMHFYKIPIENLLVIHDEIDQLYGTLKFQKNRGAGGHNGIKSITTLLGTQDYARLRLGVSRPPDPRMDVSDWVLSQFSTEEWKTLPDFLSRACDGIDSFIKNGLERTANVFNQN